MRRCIEELVCMFVEKWKGVCVFECLRQKAYHPHNLSSTTSVFFKLPPMLVRFLMSLLLLCTEERKTFATSLFAVGLLRLMTQKLDLAGDLGVKLVPMCHNLVKSTRLMVFS
ncbi:hypothetical protein ElyMa_004226900 [Elysia marginata]|uniref:Uncharacterized protein n=1 Tax=Elysia marginata TaxID=1093978 RepID=A0AAV4GP56_9GAST|nr:hypothetical protein ElyMa_004226900 [Elysia marginata]